MSESDQLEGIAIVGMAGRFPGARNITEFWRNLVEGKETISRATDEELTSAGLDAAKLAADPTYVPARGRIERPEWFDAAFFGINPKEAEVMDPQQRVFLEEAWAALEDAGCDPARFAGAIGVFAGMSNNTYWANNIATRPDLVDAVGQLTAMMGNEKDYLATRVAYKLNLRGPALNIYTACSTSLVAVCQACTSLLNYHCDFALAGGISITFPQERGYHFQEGGILSPDGHCRAFDVNSAGTVFSSGVGIVALRRLADAVADGDQIYAVIKGSALNNDGSQKVSFTAPSVDGHAEVIALAQAVAGIEPESISYIEAHGTATPLGDPIEIAGLTQAFRSGTEKKRFCAIGSVKTNIGHLDAAAGIAGLIKAALALKHRVLPASLHFTQPNPKLELEESPFFVNAESREWPAGPFPRRAGVSSFGVGGTNAHVVLEEAPASTAASERHRPQLLLLSAKTSAALEQSAHEVSTFLSAQDVPLADVAWTLQTGRHGFNHRCFVIAESREAAAQALEASDARKRQTRNVERRNTPVAFLFPGQGAQFAGMGSQLYQSEPVFRAAVDECTEILRTELDADIRDVLFPKTDAATENLRQTRFTQPALFVIGYALAQLWISWGIQPQAMLGHSVGEFVAACIAGVFSLRDALRLVAGRARLVQEMPSGAMLAVRLSEAELSPLLPPSIQIAALNAPALSVVAGPFEAIEALEGELRERSVAALRLATSHAFHSAMMDPVVDPFLKLVQQIPLQAPRLRIVSSLTGEWLTEAQVTDPAYWAAHLRQPVRFTNAVETLLKDDAYALLEAGPGQSLTQLLRQHRTLLNHSLSTSMPEGVDEQVSTMTALGKLWLAGVEPDWSAVHHGEARQKLSLPTYPFERQRYWATPGSKPKSEALSQLHESAGEPQLALATEASGSGAPAHRTDGYGSRLELLTNEIQQELQALSGLNLAGSDPHQTFVELGLDSLFLTQASLVLQKRFRQPISFRRLLEHSPSPAALAGWLDSTLPSEPTEAPRKAATNGGTVPPSRNGNGAAHPAKTNGNVAFGPYRAIDRSAATDLTPEQQAHLEQLIERYTRRTAGSKRAADEHRPYLADPRSIAGFRRAWKEITYPLLSERSEGSKLWDIDGNEYIDITLGFGQILFGHRPPFLVQAIEEQLHRGIEIGPTSPLTGEVAALMREFTGMERVAFCNTGSEAVVAAVRVARTVTGRDKIAMFAGGYHGIVDEVLVRAGGTGEGGLPVPVPIAPGIPTSAVENVLVLNYGDPEALETLRKHGDEIAAVLVEPVQSRRPDLQPREFLHELRSITTDCGAALVFDEVVTGFRCMPGGAQAWFDVRADLATYGKIVGGGMPIGIVAGDGRFMDALDGGSWRFGDDSVPEVGVTFFAGTFVRHPLALAAARAILRRLKESGPDLQKTLNARTTKLVGELNAHLEQRELSLRWTHFSSLFHLPIPPELRHAGLLFHHLRLRGFHTWEGRPCFVSAAHSDAELERFVQAFKESIDELDAVGLLSSGRGSPAQQNSFGLTEAQKELFLACQLGADASASFNDSVSLQLTGEIQSSALETAINALIERHEALRTIFDRHGVRQTVLAQQQIALEITDLTALHDDAQEAEIAHRIERHTSEPFDLDRGPLIRAELLRLGNTTSQLLLTVHHIVCDGWSFGVLASELPQLYKAATGGESGLPESTPFRSYVQWLQERAAEGTRAAAEAYWLKLFASLPPSLELPLDFPRGTQRSFRAGRQSITIPAEVLAGAKRLSAANQTTLFTTLFAAFQVLLHRLSGQDDLVVGIASAGQAAMGEDRLVGHCVNFLPVRARIAGEMSFTEHLSNARTAVLDAQDHQQLTLGTLLQKLAVPRDEGRMPLVSVAFNMDRSAPPLDFENGVSGELDVNPKSRLGLELSFNIIDTAVGTQLYCAFNRDLFAPETIARWLEHYLALCAAAVREPSTAVDALPLLTAAQRVQILEEWNRTERPLPEPCTLPELFSQWAARTPHAIAVVHEAASVTYAELDRRANAVAWNLRERGVIRGSLVGLLAERSERFVVAVLGILKAGGVYVPLDRDLPPARLEQLKRDCVTVIDRDADLTAERETGPEPQHGPESPAYVLYTSGTTGEPKGVAVPHQAVVRLVCNTDYVQMRSDDVVALASNPCFDAITFELWGALLNGGRLIVTPTETLLSPRALEAHMERHGITTLFLTTSLFNQLAQQAPTMFRKLRSLVFGGEAADAASVRMVLENGKPENLVNGYGPTETTTFAVCHRVERIEGQRIPIGRPIANTRAFILDRQQQPVPIGVTGELFIGGPGVALGYINSLELTAERFLETTYGRLYKTGDLARWLPDGTIDYLGRRDQQIKLRGFRIEPGEIEAAMRRVPGVKMAAVLVREIAPGDRRLIAYFTVNADSVSQPKTIRSTLTAVLPGYMVPSSFIEVPQIPLTSNGKLAVDQLPLPTAPEEQQTGIVQSRNALDAQLIEIWEELLDRRPVGIRDNFFALGGHSLLAARMLAQVEARLGRRAPFATLFEQPTIEHLSNVLLKAQANESEQPFVAIHPNGTRRPFFFLHGDYVGGGFFCQTLARHIGSDRPFYAVHPHGLVGDKPGSIEAMAAERLALIRKIQPTGPYLLGGYCNGALTAFEIARLLQAEGEEVAGLVMLAADGSSYRLRHWESIAKLAGQLHGEDAEARRQRFLHWRHKTRLIEALVTHYASVGRNLLQQPWPERVAHLRDLSRRLRSRFTGERTKSSPPGAQNSRQPSLSDAFHDAILSFVPHSFAGHAILLWPKDEPAPANNDPQYGWEQVCDAVQLTLVPGNHHSCISQSKNLGPIGDEIRRALETAESERRS